MNRVLVNRLTLVLAAALALTASATSEDRWRGIGPGGGGALFHPTVSPHDPRTALVACDMTGSYITTDAGSRWRTFNLGGAVEFFLFDPIDPRVIYAKAGALFRSTDGGTTWARFFPGTVAKVTMGDDHASHKFHVASGPRGDIGAMAIDPKDSRALYLAIDSALWTSGDGGTTWRKSADLPGRARRMWIDPGSSKADRTLYVAGPDAMYRRQAGAWRTGASPGVFTDVTGTPPRFYATSAGKIFVSADGGMTWSPSSLPGFGGRAPTPRSSRGQALPRKGGGSKEVVAAVRWCIRTCIDAGARTTTAVLPIRFHIRRIDLRILGDPPGQGGKFHRLQKRNQLACIWLVHREFVERHVELDLVVEQHQLPRDPRLLGVLDQRLAPFRLLDLAGA